MSQEYSACEVAQNNGRGGQPAWLIVKGGVYDMTTFLKEHPGGEDTILEYAGRDATKAFNEVGHSADAVKQLKLYKIGVLTKEVSAGQCEKNECKTELYGDSSVVSLSF